MVMNRFEIQVLVMVIAAVVYRVAVNKRTSRINAEWLKFNERLYDLAGTVVILKPSSERVVIVDWLRKFAGQFGDEVIFKKSTVSFTWTGKSALIDGDIILVFRLKAGLFGFFRSYKDLTLQFAMSSPCNSSVHFALSHAPQGRLHVSGQRDPYVGEGQGYVRDSNADANEVARVLAEAPDSARKALTAGLKVDDGQLKIRVTSSRRMTVDEPLDPELVCAQLSELLQSVDVAVHHIQSEVSRLPVDLPNPIRTT